MAVDSVSHNSAHMKEKSRPLSNKAFAAITLIVVLVGMTGAWYFMRMTGAGSAPLLSIGMPERPYSILVMGTDVPYNQVGRRSQEADKQSFSGRSDTMILVMVDPKQRTLRGINIPRDTVAQIPGHGVQKVNAANAIGGPALAKQTVGEMLNTPVDHFLVINVQGLVEAVNQLGGVTLNVPKRMSYMDWTAKLKIDLEPGVHTLTGNQAMGFVRFRHDDMGDIGRIQRQQIFMHALIGKLVNPLSWPHFPQLAQIARKNMLTDLRDLQLLQAFNFVRSVPRDQIQFAMLPGTFGSSGSWIPDEVETNKLMARLYGLPVVEHNRQNLTVCLKNVSSFPGLADRMAQFLRNIGYSVVVMNDRREQETTSPKTRIIAQRGNYEEAQMVLHDLGNRGEIVNASIGDIYSSITVEVADDMEPLMRSSIASESVGQYN